MICACSPNPQVQVESIEACIEREVIYRREVTIPKYKYTSI